MDNSESKKNSKTTVDNREINGGNVSQRDMELNNENEQEKQPESKKQRQSKRMSQDNNEQIQNSNSKQENNENEFNESKIQNEEQQGNNDNQQNEEQNISQNQEQNGEQQQQEASPNNESQRQNETIDGIYNCQKCLQLEEKIVDQEMVKERLQKQSEKMRNNIAELKQLQEDVMNKIKEQKNQQKKKEIDPQEKKLMEELKQLNSKFLYFRNRVNQCEKELQVTDHSQMEKYTEVMNQIKEVDDEIKFYKKENELKERTINSYNDEMSKLESDRELLNKLKKQAMDLRKEFNELRSENIKKEKSMLVSQEYLHRISKHFRSIKNKNGIISNQLQKSYSQQGNYTKYDSIVKHNFNKKKKERDDLQKKWDECDLTKEGIEKKKKEEQDLVKKKKETDAQHKQEIEQLQQKITIIEREKSILDQQLKEKTKEMSIMDHRQKELNRYKRYNILPPLEESVLANNSRVQQQKNIKIKDYIDPHMMRHKSTKNLSGNGAKENRTTRAQRQKKQANRTEKTEPGNGNQEKYGNRTEV